MGNQKKVKWGVISTAKIGLKHVLPAMQNGELTEIHAIASRNSDKAEKAAAALGIPKTYGSYEALLEDPEIQAVYIPLPNHLHIPWIRKAVEAGKHVLCEKPLVLQPEDIDELDQLQQDSGLIIGEAFMVLHQPRWKRLKEMVHSGALGELRCIQGFFSYNNGNPDDIRNKPEYGGGGLYDIGCYPIVLSRFVFDEEPVRVTGSLQYDQNFKIDMLSSFILEFPDGKQASFIVSTQTSPHQRMEIFGTKNHFELRLPFNTPDDREMQILSHGNDILEPEQVESSFQKINHYTLQGDAFSKAVLEGGGFAGSLKNARGNARVIKAIFNAAEEGRWVEL